MKKGIISAYLPGDTVHLPIDPDYYDGFVISYNFECPICEMTSDQDVLDAIDINIECPNCKSLFEKTSENWNGDCHGIILRKGTPPYNPNGNCPKDSRANRPIYIRVKGKVILAVADGHGHAYRVHGTGYSISENHCTPHNRYDPKDYEFICGLSGMDY